MAHYSLESNDKVLTFQSSVNLLLLFSFSRNPFISQYEICTNTEHLDQMIDIDLVKFLQ